MSTNDPELHWSDERWIEPGDRSSPWRAGCRRLQGWYRQDVMGVRNAGPRSASSPNDYVLSMLPLESAANVFESAGEEHPDSGSAFDAFVVYAAGSKRRFLAIECKYAEKLTESFSAREQMKKTRDGTEVMKIWGDGYRDYTKECRLWVDDAWEPMDKRGLQQFWLNTLLAQSLLKRGKGDQSFEGGTSVVMAHAKDTDAKGAVAAVAKQLRPGNVQLVWSPYECLIEKLPQRTWVDDFRARYLDFTPVEQLLLQGDPRRKDAK